MNSRALERAAAELDAPADRVRYVLWHADLSGFGPERRDPAYRERLGWPEDAFVVLSLRNFRPDTHLDVLVRAFDRVRRDEPRARLVLAARGGPLRGEVEQLVDRLGLRDVVAFASVPVPELPTLIASADVAVTLTDSDSSPPSLLESMASGLPLVATPAASIEEWVGQGDGAEIVSNEDDASVADALLRLARDPGLRARYGERNRRVVLDAYGDPDRGARAHLRGGDRRVRILALGMDGADHALVEQLMGEGRLPTISRLAREGTFGPLRSTIPAFTPVAWSSFLTGLNPGRHGIFNFTTNPNRGQQRMESAASRAGHAVLADARRRRPPLRLRRHPDDLSARADRGHRRDRLRRPRAARDPAAVRGGEDLRGAPEPRHRAPSDGGALVGELPAVQPAPARAPRRDGRRVPGRDGAGARPLAPRRRLHEHRPHGPPRLQPVGSRASRARPGAGGRRADPGLRARRRGLRRADRLRDGPLGRGADRPALLRPRDEADLLVVPRRPLARASTAISASAAARCSRGGTVASTISRRSTSASSARCAGTAGRST